MNLISLNVFVMDLIWKTDATYFCFSFMKTGFNESAFVSFSVFRERVLLL